MVASLLRIGTIEKRLKQVYLQSESGCA